MTIVETAVRMRTMPILSFMGRPYPRRWRSAGGAGDIAKVARLPG
jgi:hypothetical protein